MFKKALLFFLFCLFSATVTTRAADHVPRIKSIPVEGRLITMDELGNTYLVRNDNVLIRYNSQGDSTGFYRSVLNGDIGTVDVTNPLRILLYYTTYAKVLLLDRMLSEKTEVDLRRQRILSATAAATSSDGKLWVYDPFNAKLLKLDESGDISRSSNDLRQEINFVPNPVFMLERDRRVYVSDTARGILVFDQFGSYINTLPLYSISRLQAFDQQLVYRTGDTLHSYDIKTFDARTFVLPSPEDTIIDAAIGPNTLSVLYRHRLIIYPWPLKP